MSKQVPELFQTKYDTRVRQTFQDKGNKLLPTITTKPVNGAEKLTLFVAGQGEATERPARNQEIPYMNAGRSKVELALTAYFAGDPLDWEDLEKMEINDIQTIADQGAMALGRKVDDVIITELNGTTKEVGDGSEPYSYKMHREAMEEAHGLYWGEEDGAWTQLLGPNAWGHMMTYDQFVRSDYIRDENMPLLNKSNSRMFEGVKFILHNRLKSPGSNRERGLLYYGPAIAGAGEAVGADITWQGGQKQWWDVMNKVRAGCKRHEADAVIALDYATNIAFRNALHPAPA